MTDANKKEITEEDVEFLLKQAEIHTEQTKGMTKEQKQDYLSKLDKDKAGAVMVIAFAHASAKKQERWHQTNSIDTKKCKKNKALKVH